MSLRESFVPMNTDVTVRNSLALMLGAVAILLGCVGCTATLDDGYRPRMLNASSSQRRAYYATPFTPEAEEAGPDQAPGPSQHKPGSY
jgi:hypothetical protein